MSDVTAGLAARALDQGTGARSRAPDLTAAHRGAAEASSLLPPLLVRLGRGPVNGSLGPAHERTLVGSRLEAASATCLADRQILNKAGNLL